MFLTLDLALAHTATIPDPIKNGIVLAIREQHAKGHCAITAAGHDECTAQAVTKDQEIDNVCSGIRLDDRKKLFDSFVAKAEIAMTGDMVDDVPAPAAAAAGLAMGTGAHGAVIGAFITVQTDTPMGIVGRGKRLLATLHDHTANLFFAFDRVTIGGPIAVWPLRSPMIAAAAMALSSVLPFTTVLRLREGNR